MNSEKTLSRNQGTFYVVIVILITSLIVGFLMYILNDTFRNPSGQSNSISEWKASLKSNTQSGYYLDQIRTSLMLSLEDSSYLVMTDSELVSILMSAQVVSVSGYVPRVENSQEIDKVTSTDRYFRSEYFAIIVKEEYVLVVDKKCVPVWGTRPVENKIVPSPHIKALRVPQKISLRFFIFFV